MGLFPYYSNYGPVLFHAPVNSQCKSQQKQRVHQLHHLSMHHLNHLLIVAPKSYHKLGMSCKKLFNMHFQLPTHVSIIKQRDENQPLYNALTKHYASQSRIHLYFVDFKQSTIHILRASCINTIQKLTNT